MLTFLYNTTQLRKDGTTPTVTLVQLSLPGTLKG